jgi:lathosterol oxidase
VDLLGITLALLAVIALERTRLRRVSAPFLRAHFAADLAFYATGVVALGIAMRSAAERTAFALGVPPLPAWPVLATFALTLALYDFGAWLSHRIVHRSAFLWRVHKVHHASPQLDWLAAFRMHPIELAIRHALSPVLLLLLGFPLAQVSAASILAGGWAALVHANLDVRWHALEWLLVTPRLHHLHHVPATSDRNFGAIFSVWDRLAGRLLRASAPRDAVLGVPGELGTHPHGWWEQLRAPFLGSSAPAAGNAFATPSARRLPLAQ